MRRPEVFAPLAHRQFRLLTAGQLVSGLGDWLDFLGLIVLVAFQWHSGPTGLALLSIAVALPWVLVSPLAGVWADRLPGRTVLVGCDLVRAGVVLCYLLAPNLAVLVALVVVKTCFATLFVPAEQALVKRIIPADDLLAANALATFVGQAAKVAGPAIGGLLVAAGGPHSAFVVDALSFLVSALILIRLPGPPTIAAASRGAREPVVSAMRDGAVFIVRNRSLVLAVGAMTATVFLVFAFDTLSPLALARLGMGPSLLGVALAGVGLGAVLGAAGFGQYGRRSRPLAVIGGCEAFVGLLVGFLGAAVAGHVMAPALVWLVVLTLIGAGAAGIFVMQPYVLQQETPDNMIGRVSATALAVVTTMQIVAPPVGAAAANRYGVGAVFLLGGLGLVLVGTVLVVVQPGVPGTRDQPRSRLEPELSEPDVVAHVAGPGIVAVERFRLVGSRPAFFG